MTEVRELTNDQLEVAGRLTALAFGTAADVTPERLRRWQDEHVVAPRLGAFDGDRLVATAQIRPYRQWYLGRTVPVGGIGGVAVAPADRGRGIASDLMRALLPRMRAAGQVISVLYPSVPGLYRRTGWETAGTLTEFEFAPSALAAVPVPDPTVRIREAGKDDVETVVYLYQQVGEQGTGLFTRDGPMFSADEMLTLDGVVIAERDGQACGYTSYTREVGRLVVHDLICDDLAAGAALLRHLASWGTVTKTLRMRVLDPDLLTFALPLPLGAPVYVDRWMARIVDAGPAMAARGWPDGLTISIDFDVTDPDAPWNAGRYRLVIADGEAQWEPGGTGAVGVHIRALASLYSSYASAAALRRAGLLTGGPADLAAVDAAFAGPRPQLLDAF
jgi:predicted acetyltransferase